jgi:hypothetical protein
VSVVGGDRFVGDAECPEDECGDEAGPVLAACTEERHRVTAWVGDQLDDCREPIAEALEHHHVGLVDREVSWGVDTSTTRPSAVA